ncbi:MAG: hypothetical protein ACKV2Q_11820 [Planctomycetaceae bacterium]
MRAIITILCTMFLLPTVSLAEGKKYALLVGVAKYDPSQLNRLQFAEDDATEMGKVLEKLGFEGRPGVWHFGNSELAPANSEIPKCLTPEWPN